MPFYTQIVEQVSTMAVSGVLETGERLPTLRALARELGVNRNTVSRAYSELEREGVIMTNHGGGSRVGPELPKMSARERKARLAQAVDALLAEARRLSLSEAELHRALTARTGGLI